MHTDFFQNKENSFAQTALEALEVNQKLKSLVEGNLANARTLNYKARYPVISEKETSFGSILKELSFEIVEDSSKGKIKKINGKEYQESNVDINKEFAKLPPIALLNKAILATLQLNNKIELDIINTLGNTR